MRKLILLFCTLICASQIGFAAVGDTTWVQANLTNLDNYGNYDTGVVFPAPGKTYRKIYMIFTLGKHTCPGYTYGTGSVPWCGDWDYTVLNYVMTPGGDTVELSRLITPYANGGGTLPNIPYTWTDRYIYDVTDYAALLEDSATMRILYSGYSGGFTANVRFAFIEGTPERNVLGITRLWHGSFNYGDTIGGDSINAYFPSVTETPPSGAEDASLKFIVTGHGYDSLGCCEFAEHSYHVYFNSADIADVNIWRSDCGANELYPQSGTWLLQRANWCPGALVYPNFQDLSGISAGTPFNLDIRFDPYIIPGLTASSAKGLYTTEANLLYYGAVNKSLDASLDDIIAPSNYEGHFRENPISGTPVIQIRNTGSTVITAMNIQYAVDGGTVHSYAWTGTLASLTNIQISLPAPPELQSISGSTGMHTFAVDILQVNGTTDDDNSNNKLTSSFVAAPSWPNAFTVNMKTNNETVASGLSDQSWRIYDQFGSVVASRTGAAINSYFKDTVVLGKGWYRLVVSDANCDGFSWWAFAESGITDGYINVGIFGGGTLPLNGDIATGEYNNDFGCGFTQYFTVDSSEGVNNIVNPAASMAVYPNPAQNSFQVQLNGLQQISGEIHVLDAVGRVVKIVECSNSLQYVNASDLASGIYNVIYIDRNSGTTFQQKVIIEH